MLPEPGKLIDALRADDNLTAFADALEKAGLVDLLSGSEEYTIIAPANFVLDNMDSMSADQLATTLKGYIVQGKLPSQALQDAGTLTTLAGTTLTIAAHDNAIFVNDAQVIDLNIPATNGVIHLINGLLTRSAATPAS